MSLAPPRVDPVRPAAGLATATLPSPLGPLLLVAGPRGLRAVLWPGEDGSRVTRALSRPASPAAGVDPDPPGSSGPGSAAQHLEQARAEVEQYLAGTRQEFSVALDPVGTPFQLRAWQVLRAIPFGQTVTYAQQALALGSPAAARAVGAADGRNPLSIVVPCHRVVATGGALTGFAGGLRAKEWLLAHERQVLRGATG